MKYIIFDLEWNQPSSAKEKVEGMVHGEIIQIGFLVIDSGMNISHREEIMIKPVCYTTMHKYVSVLTGIKQCDIDKGTDFKSAICRMAEFFDDETVIITWGDDDMPLIADNLKYHGMNDFALPQHYNLQRIFSMQTGTNARQTGLKTAMEQLDICSDIQAHDALNDAYMTYLVAEKLDLIKGIADYGKFPLTAVDKSTQQPWNFENPLYTICQPYSGSPDALAAVCRKIPVHCHDCGKIITADIIRQGKLSFITLCKCEEHGVFFMRYELKSGQLTVSCYRSNETFERIYKNRVKQKEKKRLYKENYKKKT